TGGSSSAACSLSSSLKTRVEEAARRLSSTRFASASELLASSAESEQATKAAVSDRRASPDSARFFISYLQFQRDRSEEHTSELQSRFDLVCRLLLEKKNNQHSA